MRRVRAAEGEDHPHTVEDMIALAKLYVRQRRMEEAEPLLLESMKRLREAALGGGGSLLLVCMDSLAGVYVEQEKLEEAEPLLLESIAKCRELLGDHHPNTLSKMTQLAVLYYKKGKRGEAEAGKPRMWIR
uniref:Kinesin light chain n=1 Tax=Guillardia theta TaxID=55529 RepID=A0A7S4U901_GUITH